MNEEKTEAQKLDALSIKGRKELEQLWGHPYRWENEWDRWGWDNPHGDLYQPIRDYYTKTKKFELDPYFINRDQAGIGMQETIITDGFYPYPSNCMILNVGSGNGDLDKLLSQDNTVIGMDIGKIGVERFYEAKRYKDSTLLYMDCANDRFPFPDRVFDIVIFTEVIEHLSDPLHTIIEIKRVLKEDGHLIISFPEQEDQRGTFGGNHGFLYPGLFERKDWRRFAIQCFFLQLKYTENGGTGKYLYKNVKRNFISPIDLAKGDWKCNILYESIRNGMDMEQQWPNFTIQDCKDFSCGTLEEINKYTKKERENLNVV